MIINIIILEIEQVKIIRLVVKEMIMKIKDLTTMVKIEIMKSTKLLIDIKEKKRRKKKKTRKKLYGPKKIDKTGRRGKAEKIGVQGRIEKVVKTIHYTLSGKILMIIYTEKRQNIMKSYLIEKPEKIV